VGATTPSYDMETEPNEHFPFDHITKELIENTLPQFIGDITQIPPLFSAIKVDGKRAYTLARQGSDHELKSRVIHIREFEITRLELPEIDFRVSCSKGTYIRTLAFDFGHALGSGAYLSALRRTKIGNYSVLDSVEPQNVTPKIIE
jgi:tRNA pseudouridine55 synthase